MNISELSIKRPVLATVMVLVITLFGLIGYTFLGTREFPSVDQPIITVNVSYPGANADVIMNQITEPLEQNINGIPGIRSLSSISSQGSSRITVEFELSVDLETAANDVRDKVSRAQRYLPRDCDPPTVSKADADASPILQIAVSSDKRSMMEVSEIADLTVKERLQTIQDVSAVELWGEKRYSMRLWLDPVKMAGYGVTPMDVKGALDKENVELPSGRIEGNKIELSIRTLGLMSTPYEFNNVIIKQKDGQIVRFQDVGWAELGPEDQRSAMRNNGMPTVVAVIIPQPGANHIKIADEAKVRIEQLRKDIPEDVTVEMMYDNTKYIRASIKEVRDTIFVAFILVVFIIFVFLRDWRVTLVPVVVIPVSLVGAFFVMYLAGFSVNVLTMLAVVLSVGLVVDDAIVMTENIYIRIERGMSPKEAGIEGAKEIFFAVISTTITLVAVFLPIIFMEGMTGRLFKEFSIVIAGSVTVSSLVALTFTPMLATKILKKHSQATGLYAKTEPFFNGMISGYGKLLDKFLKVKWVAIILMVLFLVAVGYYWQAIPSELSPLEDRSNITVRVTGQEGSTFEFVRDITDRIEYVTDSVAYENVTLANRSWGSMGMISVFLPDIKDRERSQMEIAEQLTRAVGDETQARVFVQQTSTFGGRRGGMPVQYVLQAPTLAKLQSVLPAFMEQVSASPVLRMADVNLKFTKPETRIVIDRDKATSLGVSTLNIAQTLQYALSGQRMGYFYMNGKQYQILGEINRQQRNKPLDLKSIFVRNTAGDMIQLDNVVKLVEDVAPPQLYRYNRFVSATVSSGLAPGKTIGDGLDEMDRIAADVLDDSFRTALSGESKEFRESSSSLMFAMLLALVLIYLTLAAQFESFKDPLIVMFTVPLALAGALAFMSWTGDTMNIFSQIGLIMLIGLVAKNGILIVEFANQKQEAGFPKMEAIAAASTQRLRPVLMTSISTILGLLPLVFASGEGANGRISMGIAVVSGLTFGTLMTLFVVPAIYAFVSTDRQAKAQKAAATGSDTGSGAAGAAAAGSGAAAAGSAVGSAAAATASATASSATKAGSTSKAGPAALLLVALLLSAPVFAQAFAQAPSSGPSAPAQPRTAAAQAPSAPAQSPSAPAQPRTATAQALPQSPSASAQPLSAATQQATAQPAAQSHPQPLPTYPAAPDSLGALYPVSLRQCIDEGLRNNYAVRIMRNTEQVAANNATRGNAGQLPLLDLSATYAGTDYTQNYRYPDATTSRANSFNNNVYVGADLTWTVFNGFSIQANYAKLKELKVQGELDMRLTLEDFVAAVAQEYYYLIRQRIRLHNLGQTVTLSRERLRIVQESYHIGAASGLDYQQARVDFNADTSDYMSQVELVRSSEIQLNEMLALPDIERRTSPIDTSIVPNANLDRNSLWDNTLTNNVSLLQAISNQTISEYDYKRVKSRNYPYLNISAGYGYRNYWYQHGTYTKSNQFGPTLGASAGIAIYDGGNRRREQRNARLEIENSKLRVEQMENSLRADMASLWMAYQNNLELWEIEKANLVVARSNFAIAMERYRLRELSGIELREAQLSLLQSEERLSTVEYNIKICEISLLVLSGQVLEYKLN